MRYIMICLACCISSLSLAQDIDSVLRKGWLHLALGNTDQAALEFERSLFFAPQKQQYKAFHGMAEAQMAMGDFGKAYISYSKAALLSGNDSFAAEMTLKQVELQMTSKRYSLAQVLTEDLPETSNLVRHKKWLYLTSLHILQGQPKLADSTAQLLAASAPAQDSSAWVKLRKDFYHVPRPKPLFARISSYIIPGSGQAMSGKVGDGVNSLLLNGAIGFLAYRVAVVYGPVSSVVLVLPLFYRYYNGGAVKAQQYAKNKMLKQQEEQIRETTTLYQNLHIK